MSYRSASELRKLCVNDKIDLKSGLKIMDSLKNNVIFVVSDRSDLLGIVTDGDFRRAILAGVSYTTPLSSFMNKHPIAIDIQNADKESIKTVMITKNIRHLPIVEKGVVRDIVLNEDLLKEKELLHQNREKLENPIVIMAGGKGTRLDPFTRILPKPLLPVGDKTILEIIIDRFLPYQVNDFYLTVNYKSIVVKSYFEELMPDYRLHYIEEEKFLGTAGSLKSLESKFKDPLLVTNCDILVDAYYPDLVKHHNTKNYDITMAASLKHYNIPYGVCEIENGGELKEIKEKPEYSFLVNTGMYVLNPSVLSLIPDDTVFHITHLMEKVKKSGGKVGLYPVSSNDWLDVGEWNQFKSTVEKIELLRREKLD